MLISVDMLSRKCCSSFIIISGGVLVENGGFKTVMIPVGVSSNADFSGILVFQMTFLNSILNNSISENPFNTDLFFGLIMFLLITLLTSSPTFLNIVT